ncbi:asparagine synthase (glutamine-hydrolyzing) [Psychromicrobium silvestre]|uniref:asparagine synthase (glutamine-hydrolyzing) n=1 Tax=Psychromicrobium silvestre TaxID=1645614 RepID=A0A7Y9LVZ3_9MICC|nr:asparagine synthase (glutamine-hydrolyzing) [Psychromicrobium silvestre]NYE96628.1 asparagine synthase (glutamine-hydrolyzing) [Psychromicrobium silvestre]
MCGIAGWVSFERDLREERQVAQAMTETMICRGPDDEGLWIDRHVALGHRRLSIIDLDNGKQPMLRQDEGATREVLIYTGETYNFRELREQLSNSGRHFRTRSDTEVVLQAHHEWGATEPRNAVERFNGMFAYALWDTAKEELILVRDRLGIKPLYYLPTADGVLFGSEPKAILANPLAERSVDLDGLRRLLGFVGNPGNAVFKGMREVPPAHIVRINRQGITEQRYWALDDHEHVDDLDTTIKTVRELLEDTAEHQLIADVPLGTLLSGGLDSSALTALAAEQLDRSGEGVRSFSVDFAGYEDDFKADELRDTPDGPYVIAVAEHLKARYAKSEHTNLVLNNDELMDPAARSAVLTARDFPGMGDMDTSLYLLFKAVRQHSTVALSGESADEVFGGYKEFHDPQARDAGTFPWFAGAMARGIGRTGTWNSAFAAKLDMPGYVQGEYHKALAEVPRRAGETGLEARMREVSYLYLTRFLPNLLDRKDRMSMAVGLEVRVPFCDHRLVQYVYGTPWAMKTFDGREKSLLRAATKHLLPESVVQRVKSPYPSTQDPAYNKSLFYLLGEVLDRGDSPIIDLVDAPRLKELVRTGGSGASSERYQAESVLQMDRWVRSYGLDLQL